MYLFEGKTVCGPAGLTGIGTVGDKKVEGDGKRPKGFIISTGKIQKADITCRSEFPIRIQQTRLRRMHLANLRGEIFLSMEKTPNLISLNAIGQQAVLP